MIDKKLIPSDGKSNANTAENILQRNYDLCSHSWHLDIHCNHCFLNQQSYPGYVQDKYVLLETSGCIQVVFGVSP